MTARIRPFHARSARFLMLAAAVAFVVSASPVTAHTWGAARPLTTSGEGAVWPGSLASTGPTSAVASYREIVGGKIAVFVRTTADSGLTWSPRKRLSSPAAAFATRVTVAADGQDVAAVWVEGGNGCARGKLSCHLMYATSADGGGTFAAPVSLDDASFPGFSQVVRSGSRTLIAWSSWRLGIVYSVLIDGGSGVGLRHVGTTSFHPFGDLCKVGPGAVCKDGFVTAALGDGVAYVSFFSTARHLRVVRSVDDGATWVPSASIAADAAAGGGIAAGAADSLVTYSRAVPGHMWVVTRSSSDSGANWSAETALSPRTGPYSFGPVAHRGADGSYDVAFGRCNSQACPRTAVYLRSAAGAGGPWAAAEKVPGGGTYGFPSGIASTARLLVMSLRLTDAGRVSNVVVTPGG